MARPAAESAHPLGYQSGHVVQEYYYDSDCDDVLRTSIEEATGEALVDEDYDDLADGALIWWRSEDAAEEELSDLLMDAAANLDNGGVIAVLTPKSGREGHVAPADIEAAAVVVGMHTGSALALCSDWSGFRLTVRSR